MPLFGRQRAFNDLHIELTGEPVALCVPEISGQDADVASPDLRGRRRCHLRRAGKDRGQKSPPIFKATKPDAEAA